MALTLDTGALLAFERKDAHVRRALELAFRLGEPPTVPTVVVAQAWRDGRRQARIASVLESADVEPLDETLARRAGELLGRTGTSDAVDAVVAQSAARRGDIVLTSDPDDLQVLADDLRTIHVRPI